MHRKWRTIPYTGWRRLTQLFRNVPFCIGNEKVAVKTCVNNFLMYTARWGEPRGFPQRFSICELNRFRASSDSL